MVTSVSIFAQQKNYWAAHNGSLDFPKDKGVARLSFPKTTSYYTGFTITLTNSYLYPFLCTYFWLQIALLSNSSLTSIAFS